MYAQVAQFPGAGGVYVSQPVLVSSSRHHPHHPHQFAPLLAGPPIAVQVQVPLSPCSLPMSPISPAAMPIGGPASLHHHQQQPHQHHRSSSSQSSALPGEGPTQLRKLFIGGLNHETTDEQLKQYYSRWGQVVDCIVIRDPQTKHSRGFGFVTFLSIQMAEASMAERPHTINNKVVDPKRAIPREEMSPFFPNHPPHFLEAEADAALKVELTGIHWDSHTVDGLRDHFATFGSVVQVEILGHPRGSGFVVFEEKGAVERCLATKFHTINGRKCEVLKEKPSTGEKTAAADGKTPKSDGGGGGGSRQSTPKKADGSTSPGKADSGK